MTPLELSILIHYRGCANDFRDGDFSSPSVRSVIDYFCGPLGLLEGTYSNNANYKLTERGRVFVDALCETPLPIQTWVMPSEGKP